MSTLGFPYIDHIVEQLVNEQASRTNMAINTRPVENVTGSSITVTEGETGKLFLLNRAAGIAVALPAITESNVGMSFEFYVGTTFSGGSGVITAQSGDLLTGSVTQYDGDTSEAVAHRKPDGSDDLLTTFNGTTTGGIAGTIVRFVATSSTSWLVTGNALATGSVATCFS